MTLDPNVSKMDQTFRNLLNPRNPTFGAKFDTKSGLTIVRLDRFWDLGTFPIGSRSYPRIRPHELAIQIDIIGALLFGQGGLGRWSHEGTKNWQNLVGEDTWPFSGPGERSRGIETGNLQEIAVRTWWDHSRGIKLTILGQKFPKLPVCRV